MNSLSSMRQREARTICLQDPELLKRGFRLWVPESARTPQTSVFSCLGTCPAQSRSDKHACSLSLNFRHLPPKHEIHKNTDKRGSSEVQEDASSLLGEPTARGRGFSHQAWQGEGFPGGASAKESACQCRRWKRWGFDPWVRKIPWKRAWQSTPVFLPRESHGQRSLVGLQSIGLQRTGHDWSDLALRQARVARMASSARASGRVSKQATRWQHLHELHESWHWEPPQKLLKLKTCLFPLCSLCSLNQTLEAYQTWCSASDSVTPRQAPLVLCCLHPQRSPQYSHLCWLTPAQESLPPNSWLQRKTGAWRPGLPAPKRSICCRDRRGQKDLEGLLLGDHPSPHDLPCTHTCMYTHVHTCMFTHVHMYTHADHRHAPTLIGAYTLAHMNAHIHVHTWRVHMSI